jgi:hypothetical protein
MDRTSYTPIFCHVAVRVSAWVSCQSASYFGFGPRQDRMSCQIHPRQDRMSCQIQIHRIWGHRPQGKLPAPEYLVQWKGYYTSQMF